MDLSEFLPPLIISIMMFIAVITMQKDELQHTRSSVAYAAMFAGAAGGIAYYIIRDLF